jgi:ribosomal 30S subunit maturation factor RimM
VHDVIDAGGASYLEVEIEGGAGKPGARRCLVPFRKEFVGAVEIEKGCLELLKPWVLDTQS